MSGWTRGLAGILLLGSFGLVPLSVDAQDGEVLPGIDRLLTEGRFAEARTELEVWLERDWEGAGRADRQHGLWLRALLTIDPGMAELDLRRLVIEYPGGTFSDEALLRLAQGARARGDLVASEQFLEILLRDYPQSPHRIEARTLLIRLDEERTRAPARSGAAAPPSAEAPPPAAPSHAGPPPAAPAQTAPPEATAPPMAATREPAPAADAPEEAAGTFALQLGAFSTEPRALALASEARAAGLDVRIVQVAGSELVRVRLGSFHTRDEAESLARELRGLGFEVVVSSDRDRESPR